MIYLLRHGETEFNRLGRYQGRADSPLTGLGQAQARAFGTRLAEHVSAPVIWTSPLPRAQETTRLLCAALPGAPVQIDERLQEISFGQWDGMTRAEIAEGWPDARRAHPKRQWMFHAPGGEGLQPLLARLGDVLASAAEDGRDIVLVSHGITGRLMRGLHAGLPLPEALLLEARQDLIWRLEPGGTITALPPTEA